MIWYNDLNDGIVISSRIRLARNIEKTPFPAALKDKSSVTKKLQNSILESNSTLASDFELYELDKKTQDEKMKLLEEHLISPQMMQGSGRSVMINKNRTMSIMFMEEDHIRLQIIMGGYHLDEAYDVADKVDDVIEESLTYAFDETFGYLTACPTNAGTGLRASVMMHLPGLVLTGNINRVLQSVSGMGIAVRGLYGEGTNSEGCMFQISNKVTMGLSEQEIINKVKNVVNKLSELEKEARKILLNKNKTETEDKVYRAYGTLKYARSISSAEAKQLLSDVMLGQNMGIIKCDGKMTPLELMVKIAPAVISDGGSLSASERDLKRAEMIRDNI